MPERFNVMIDGSLKSVAAEELATLIVAYAHLDRYLMFADDGGLPPVLEKEAA